MVIFAATGLVGWAASTKRLGTWSKLREDNEQLSRRVIALEQSLTEAHDDYFELVRKQLAFLGNELGLTESERVSIYKRDGSGFVMLGRHSKHPEFRDRRRGVYPAEGCIKEAYHQGECVVLDLPDPTTRKSQYEKEQTKRGKLPLMTLRDVRMKSRSYIALAINDHDDERPAVVVFESLQPKPPQMTLERCRTVMTREQKRLLAFIRSKHAYEPTPSEARRVGL